MPIDWNALAIPKGKTRKQQKAKRQRENRDHVAEVRSYVFEREWGVCRCCRIRKAESMHELKPKSLRGKVSRTNSVAVCGSGTTGCHGYLQAHKIDWTGDKAGAEGILSFNPRTQQAAEWMRVRLHEWVESGPYPQIGEAR